ncbi:hypothetical protein T05_3859 [Trichinella murrelli]|uniref:Uncharacterized protein n=1 Tax=Trichinella murrelli TaxID=144512 RepID=A0A0V0TZP7_9BILA|nr:hypothetical protein T05_3859 [Trichinella murrelli]
MRLSRYDNKHQNDNNQLNTLPRRTTTSDQFREPDVQFGEAVDLPLTKDDQVSVYQATASKRRLAYGKLFRSDCRPGSHGSYTWDFQVPTMTGQFWISLCPVAVHRGLYTFEKPKMARYDGSADAAEASSS